MGSNLNEFLERVKGHAHYQQLCGPKPSQAPVAVTRDNLAIVVVAAATVAAADAEDNLMYTELELNQMKLKELRALKRGLFAVGKVAFSNGS